jgi:leucyl aminopeptidase
MNFKWTSTAITDASCDTVIVMMSPNIKLPKEFDEQAAQAIKQQITAIFCEQPGKLDYGEITTIYSVGHLPAKQLLLIGCGDKQLSLDKWRALFSTAARTAQTMQSKSVYFVLPEDNQYSYAELIEVAVEGNLLGTYSFDYYKTQKKQPATIETCYITGPESVIDFNKLVAKAQALASSVNFSRDLVNQPAVAMTPTIMAAKAVELADHYGMAITVLDRQQMDDLGMQALLAVAKGSDEPPKLIVLEYNGFPGNAEKIAFIGKGITFDSGGISLKPGAGMEEMKDDMAGGAAVLGAMRAIAQLKLQLNLIALVPCTENMPSGHALRPGDVISSMSGKTIEIINTDAEGRLVLADAVTYALKLGATKLIDLATLTGACVTALGTVTSGVFTNNDDWLQQLLTAANRSGEKMWQLPLFEEYKTQIKSSIADIKNTGGREAGAITAALFIAEFAEETPWIHIDIAGTVTSSKDQGYQIKGATGVGVRTLVQLAGDIAHENG